MHDLGAIVSEGQPHDCEISIPKGSVTSNRVVARAADGNKSRRYSSTTKERLRAARFLGRPNGSGPSSGLILDAAYPSHQQMLSLGRAGLTGCSNRPANTQSAIGGSTGARSSVVFMQWLQSTTAL